MEYGKSTIKNDPLITLTYILFLCTFLLPTIGLITKGRISQILLFILVSILTLVSRNENIHNKLIIKKRCLLGYLGMTMFIIQVLFQQLSGLGVGYQEIYTTVFYIFSIMFSFLIMIKQTPASLLISIRYCLIFFFISILASIIFMIQHYAIVKYITGNANPNDQMYILANLWGLGNSIYYMALSAIYPLVFGCFINGDYIITKSLNFLLVTVIPIAIILSGSLTAILLLGFGITVFIILSILDSNLKKSIRALYYLFILIFLAYIVFVTMSDKSFALWVGERVVNTVSSMFNGHLVDESYIYRQVLNRISINSFLDNPIFGIGTHIGELNIRVIDYRHGNGNHAAIYDLLGQYGVFGGLAFMLIYTELFRQSLFIAKNLDKSYRKIVFSGISVLIISSFYNPTLLNGTYFIIIWFFYVLCMFNQSFCSKMQKDKEI